MSRSRAAVRSAGAAASALALLLLTVSPASAAAPVTVHITHPGGYSTDPSHLSGQGTYRDLGASVTIPAGQTRYLSSKLVVYSAAQVTETGSFMRCRMAGSSTVSASAIGSQNVLTGTATTTILTRGLFTAPSTANYVCSLEAMFINHAADANGHIYVSADSYIQDVQGALSWQSQTWQTTRDLDNTSANAATSPVFTVPSGATSFSVIGDVEVTTCYTNYTKPPCDQAARTTFSDAFVGTQLVVQQYNSTGAACGTAWTNGALAGTTVTNTVHHFKINTWGTVPVNTSCSSRNFRMWIRVTANASHNSIVIENNNETVTAAFI